MSQIKQFNFRCWISDIQFPNKFEIDWNRSIQVEHATRVEHHNSNFAIEFQEPRLKHQISKTGLNNRIWKSTLKLKSSKRELRSQHEESDITKQVQTLSLRCHIVQYKWESNFHKSTFKQSSNLKCNHSIFDDWTSNIESPKSDWISWASIDQE